jgi:DNA-binding PadR family transcriptional regulator
VWTGPFGPYYTVIVVKRKPIRLSGNSYAVLVVIHHLGVATPYELKAAIERSTQNFWQVPHTTAYDEPARLAAAGYLSEQQERGGRRRKRYALTDAGREALAAWAQETETDPPQLRDEGLLKIFAGAPPEPIIERRRAWHTAKLAELQGYLDAIREACGDEREVTGPERTLLAGIAYHRMMLETIEQLAAQRAQASAVPSR